MQSPSQVEREQAGDAPRYYSSVAEEYEALTGGLALLDRSSIGRLSLTGEDALDLLNRLSTNALLDLEVGRGTPTVLTSNKGRIVDLLHVFRLESSLAVWTSPPFRQKVIDWLDFYTIMEELAVEDVTPGTAMLSVAGPDAADFLDGMAGTDVSGLERYEFLAATIGGVAAEVYRTDFVGLPGYDITFDTGRRQILWQGVLEAGKSAGIVPVGAEALDVVRVEKGIPAHGKELTENFNPLEAGLIDFISFNKGCYVGQEVVARLNTYDKVQRRLVGLAWDPGARPDEGAKLLFDGRQAGVVTSVVRSPRLSEEIALGYVRKAQGAPGTVLTSKSAQGDIAVTVENLPFL